MQTLFPRTVQRSWQPTISMVVPASNEAGGLDRFPRRTKQHPLYLVESSVPTAVKVSV